MNGKDVILLSNATGYFRRNQLRQCGLPLRWRANYQLAWEHPQGSFTSTKFYSKQATFLLHWKSIITPSSRKIFSMRHESANLVCRFLYNFVGVIGYRACANSITNCKKGDDCHRRHSPKTSMRIPAPFLLKKLFHGFRLNAKTIKINIFFAFIRKIS
jgi:hypothetical protein